MTHGQIACRSCGSSQLETVLSLGKTPLANALLTDSQLTQPEPLFPLDLVFCGTCSLVQITESVSPDTMFKEYAYFSSFSDTVLRHAEELANQISDARALNHNHFVIEIASNDGYLLQNYSRKGIGVLGIEPAENIAKVAREERGIPTLCNFFSKELALKLKAEGRQADVVHAHNVLAHVPDLNGFVEGIRILLKETGVAIIEVPYVKNLIDRTEFDTIYHEHLCYFSVMSLHHLFERHGLMIQRVEFIPIHGGSIRLFLIPRVAGSGIKVPPPVDQVLSEEISWGVKMMDFYRHFGNAVQQLKSSLRGLLSALKNDGKRIAAYGAAAKGSTLLNYTEIGRDFLDFVVDRNTFKQGKYMPGVHLPIYSPAKLLETMPEYVLLLTWNFADEILDQQQEYRRRGGRFILPVPEPKII